MGVLRIRDQKIKRLFFKELSTEEREKVYHIKNGANAGKSMAMFKDKTHRISLQMDDDLWYEVGHTTIFDDRPVQWRKELDGEWTTINEEALVCFKANENSWVDSSGETRKGNSKLISDSFDMIENGPANPNPFVFNPSGDKGGDKSTDSSGQKQWVKKDYSGVEIGHSINGGLIRAKHSLKDISKVIELSKGVHDLTIALKAEYKEQNPKMSDYDIGASVGHSVLNACRIGGSESIIKKNALIILESLVPPVSSYVRGEGVGEEAVADDDVVEDTVDVVEPDLTDIPDDDLPF